MQTFLPYGTSFNLTAKCLDNKRLGKQRVECLQILNTLFGKNDGWKNHPAVKMWRGYEWQLTIYAEDICKEWIRRGFKDTCLSKVNAIQDEMEMIIDSLSISYPPWIYETEIARSHRSNLVRKFPEHYRKFFPGVPDNLPYIWPA
jgi:hypothetical protein